MFKHTSSVLVCEWELSYGSQIKWGDVCGSFAQCLEWQELSKQSLSPPVAWESEPGKTQGGRVSRSGGQGGTVHLPGQPWAVTESGDQLLV